MSWSKIESFFNKDFDQSGLYLKKGKDKNNKFNLNSIGKKFDVSLIASSGLKSLLLIDALICSVQTKSKSNSSFDQNLALKSSIEKEHRESNPSRSRKTEPIGKLCEISDSWISVEHIGKRIQNSIKDPTFEDIIQNIIKHDFLRIYPFEALLSLIVKATITGEIEPLKIKYENSLKKGESVPLSIGVSDMTNSSRDDSTDDNIESSDDDYKSSQSIVMDTNLNYDNLDQSTYEQNASNKSMGSPITCLMLNFEETKNFSGSDTTDELSPCLIALDENLEKSIEINIHKPIENPENPENPENTIFKNDSILNNEELIPSTIYPIGNENESQIENKMLFGQENYSREETFNLAIIFNGKKDIKKTVFNRLKPSVLWGSIQKGYKYL